jgi:hypothetical protein
MAMTQAWIMRKKMLCSFVILAILMSAMPLPIFAMETDITNARVQNDASVGTHGFSNSTAVGAEIAQLARSLDYDLVKLFLRSCVYLVPILISFQPLLVRVLRLSGRFRSFFNFHSASCNQLLELHMILCNSLTQHQSS